MANAVLMYDNIADSATLNPVGGPNGSWESAMPITKLQTTDKYELARTTNAAEASTKFAFQFATEVPVAALGLGNVNASVAAAFRWKGYSDAFTTATYNSGVVEMYPIGTMPLGSVDYGTEGFFEGKPTEAELARFQRNIMHLLPGVVFARYWTFELFDSANAAGYFTAGRLFVGNAFQPAKNMQFGYGMEPSATNTTVSRAKSGNRFFNEERPDISFPIAFPRITEDEAMRVLDLQALAGIHGEVMFRFDPDKPEYWFRRSLMGRLARLSPIVHRHYNNFEVAFQIEDTL